MQDKQSAQPFVPDADDVQQPVPVAASVITSLPSFNDAVSTDEGVDNDESGVWHYGRSN